MLTKMKGTLLLKWLVALCVMECVGAQGAGSDTPSPSLPSTDEYEALNSHSAKGKLNAVVKGKLNAAELEAVVKLHAAELEDKKNELEAAWAVTAATAAACVLECVGAQGAGSDTPSTSLPPTDEYEAPTGEGKCLPTDYPQVNIINQVNYIVSGTVDYEWPCIHDSFSEAPLAKWTAGKCRGVCLVCKINALVKGTPKGDVQADVFEVRHGLPCTSYSDYAVISTPETKSGFKVVALN